MEPDEDSIEQRASGTASAFGSMIRGRRKALNLRQDQLALATGVGRRFLIELEAGKPSCQLGRSLLVAAALGFTPADIKSSIMASVEHCWADEQTRRQWQREWPAEIDAILAPMVHS